MMRCGGRLFHGHFGDRAVGCHSDIDAGCHARCVDASAGEVEVGGAVIAVGCRDCVDAVGLRADGDHGVGGDGDGVRAVGVGRKLVAVGSGVGQGAFGCGKAEADHGSLGGFDRLGNRCHGLSVEGDAGGGVAVKHIECDGIGSCCGSVEAIDAILRQTHMGGVVGLDAVAPQACRLRQTLDGKTFRAVLRFVEYDGVVAVGECELAACFGAECHALGVVDEE